MIRKIIKVFISIMGAMLGYGILVILRSSGLKMFSNTGWIELAIGLGVFLFFGVIFFLLFPFIMKGGRNLAQFIEKEL